MMSSSGTSRASRTSKEKSTKSQPTSQNVKADGPPKNQLQPTAEQMRLAQMISDKNDAEDPDLQNKVKQVMELTGRSSDEVIVALHDCDSDTNRAINMLLEGGNDQGEWQESVKKRKRNQPAPKSADPPPVNNRPDRREKSVDQEERQDSGPPPRSSRGGRPPRLSRGGGNFRNRGDNQGENDRNRGESGSRERGRGRGRGHMNGPGRGRGRGGRGFRSNRFEKGPQIDTWTNETAENAEKENTSSGWGDNLGAEDWTADEWTGSLDESKVFTPSVGADSSKIFSGVGDNDAQMFTAPPMPIESQVFSASGMSLGSTNSTSPALNDTTNTLHSASPLQNSLGTGSLGQSSIGQNSLGSQNSMGGQNALGTQSSLGGSSSFGGPTTLGQSSLTQNALGQTNLGQTSLGQTSLGQASLGQSSLGQRLDLGMLLKGTSESSSQQQQQQQQSQFMSQFAKQATESIKNAVGIGSSSSSASTAPVAVPNQVMQSQVSNQPPSPLVSPPQQVTLQQQRAKQQRTKLPPPSKIPASAVEMPGHVGNFQLDVEFGNWDYPAAESSSSSGFSFGGSEPVTVAGSYNATNSGPSNSVLSNHMPVSKNSTEVTSSVMTSPVISSVASNKTSMSGLDSMSGGSSQSPRSGVFQNSTSPATTPNKDYSQSAKMTPPEPIPFPSPNDRKTSPHYSQRSTASAGQLQDSPSDHAEDGSLNSKPTSSPQMTYSQSSYSSSYSSSGYSGSKSTGMSSSTSNNYNSHQSSGNALQNQYNHQYQTSSFQSPNSSFSSQTQNSLYQSPSSQSAYPNQSSSSSSYPSQTNSYQNQSSSPSYQTQSNSYQNQSSYHARDSQSSNSYPTTVSPTGTTYQSGGNQSGSSFPTTVAQSNSSSYQRDSQTGQSGYGSHQNYGGSSSHHQNSLQSSPMSASKLSDNLSKMSVKDSSIESTSQHSFEHNSSSTSSSNLTPTISTTSSTMSGGAASVASSNTLGLNSTVTSVTTSAVMNSTSTKSSLPLTTKAPPNLPPGVPPLIGHNYMIGHQGMPFAFGLQQPMYYEDLQMLQQRLPLPGYYDMPFQPPTTLTGREQNALTSVPYTAPDQKLTRVEAQSPVQAQSSQQQQTQSAHQQQAFINPTALPPGYNYYYPGAGLLPGGYSFTPQMFPVPSVTNAAAHGGTTANAQFQKPGGYGSHAYGTGYDDLSSQGQDLAKAYGGSTQTQAKVAVGSVSVASSGTDLTGAGYGKTHNPVSLPVNQSYDKATGFHAGTPPPFNLPLPTGTQAGAMGAPTAPYGAPYVPVMTHQPPSQMMHHHLQQDCSGSSRAGQQTATQPKASSGKTYSAAYWGAN